jgi:hypothetical protein
MKEKELATNGPCCVCGKPLLGSENSTPSFYVVTIVHAVFKADALQRRAGLGMQIGSRLAQVMGPDEDLAVILTGPRTKVVHEVCATKVSHLALLLGDEK